MDFFLIKKSKLKNLKNLFVNSVFIKGILMGITDIIPGISGSNIAIILGIYPQFLKSIKNINFKALFKFEFFFFFTMPRDKIFAQNFFGDVIFFYLFCKSF